MAWDGRQERRRHGRAGIHMEAFLEGREPGQDVRLKVVNFSAGGFFCLSSRPIEPLTKLGVQFLFPPYAEHPPRSIEATAVVVRCEPGNQKSGEYRMAACFTEMSGEVKEHIQGYVDWYALVYQGTGTDAE